MTEVKDGVQNNEGEEKTPVQTDPAEQTNNQAPGEDTPQKNEAPEGQEEVKMSKAEFEKIQKKAKDFDGIIEKQRIEKLKNREEKKKGEQKTELDPAKLEEIVEAKVKEQLGLRNKEEYESNLTSAYKDFITAHPWADSDEVIAAISKDFSAQGAVSKNDILVRIGQAAERTYPNEYEKAKIEKIKSQVFAGEHNIDAGEAGSGGFSKSTDKDKVLEGTPADQQLADRFFKGDLQRYLKYKQKN